jgi:UDP-N-acetylmuramate--alanine ligase
VKELRSNRAQGLDQFRRVHFVGIGGVGMSGIAQILAQRGWEVSGSDLVSSDAVSSLRSLGVRVCIGHSPDNLGDAEIVAFSSAVARENPELQEARRRGIRVVHRADLLAEIVAGGEGIAISGTHGKTTTTSMIGVLLLEAGLDPTILVGARAVDLGGNARLGQGPWVVAEADESDGSFLKLRPRYAVVTNVDRDHLDYYGGLEEIGDAFVAFMNQLPAAGRAIVCTDDFNLRRLLKKVHRPMITYGTTPAADVWAEAVEWTSGGASFGCVYRGDRLGRLRLNVPGRHNVLNSLAAVAVGLELQVPFEVIRRALGTFSGAERRLEFKGTREGVRVMDDYGHHPVEIRTTLDACRQMGRRLVVVFQPHRYTRTLHLRSELAECFQDADRLYLMDVYPAGEAPVAGGLGEDLFRAVGRHRQVCYQSQPDAMLRSLREEVTPGDLLLTLGAGNVWKIGEDFLKGRAD